MSDPGKFLLFSVEETGTNQAGGQFLRISVGVSTSIDDAKKGLAAVFEASKGLRGHVLLFSRQAEDVFGFSTILGFVLRQVYYCSAGVIATQIGTEYQVQWAMDHAKKVFRRGLRLSPRGEVLGLQPHPCEVKILEKRVPRGIVAMRVLKFELSVETQSYALGNICLVVAKERVPFDFAMRRIGATVGHNSLIATRDLVLNDPAHFIVQLAAEHFLPWGIEVGTKLKVTREDGETLRAEIVL